MESKKITAGLFGIYLVFLTWIILLKFQIDFTNFTSEGYGLRSVNLIPLRGTGDMDEFINNIIIFIPFGLYISLLKPNWGFIKRTALIFGVSLAYEILQYVFAIGTSDITDLITNTLGGIIGIILFHVLAGLFKDRTMKILNILALVGTILIIVFISLLLISNL